MRSFNLEAALSGMPVVTREGRPVTQLRLFSATKELWPLAGVVEEVVQLFTSDGKSGEGHKAMPFDLFMAAPVLT